MVRVAQETHKQIYDWLGELNLFALRQHLSRAHVALNEEQCHLNAMLVRVGCDRALFGLTVADALAARRDLDDVAEQSVHVAVHVHDVVPALQQT